MKNKTIIYLLIAANILVYVTVGLLLGVNIDSFGKVFFPKESRLNDIRDILRLDPGKHRIVPDVRVLISEKISEKVVRKKIIFRLEKDLRARDAISKQPEIAETRGFIFHPPDIFRKYPAVLVFHGHGEGVENTSITKDAYDLCKELAENGFVSFTFSLKDIEKSMGYDDHRKASRTQIVKGCPILSVYIYAGIRALDYLTYADFADRDRLGVAGESMGGHAAVYLAALDNRVKSVVNAAYFRSYSELPADPEICTCNYLPGMAEKYDFPVIASLISPRPAAYCIGENDMNTSLETAERLLETIVLPEYQKRSKKDNLVMFKHTGGHNMPVGYAVQRFKKTLYRDVR
ncbi:MAG: dienelactone hydrolase family protein [Elusimicrobiota bacterium]